MFENSIKTKFIRLVKEGYKWPLSNITNINFLILVRLLSTQPYEITFSCKFINDECATIKNRISRYANDHE